MPRPRSKKTDPRRKQNMNLRSSTIKLAKTKAKAGYDGNISRYTEALILKDNAPIPNENGPSVRNLELLKDHPGLGRHGLAWSADRADAMSVFRVAFYNATTLQRAHAEDLKTFRAWDGVLFPSIVVNHTHGMAHQVTSLYEIAIPGRDAMTNVGHFAVKKEWNAGCVLIWLDDLDIASIRDLAAHLFLAQEQASKVKDDARVQYSEAIDRLLPKVAEACTRSFSTVNAWKKLPEDKRHDTMNFVGLPVPVDVGNVIAACHRSKVGAPCVMDANGIRREITSIPLDTIRDLYRILVDLWVNTDTKTIVHPAAEEAPSRPLSHHDVDIAEAMARGKLEAYRLTGRLPATEEAPKSRATRAAEALERQDDAPKYRDDYPVDRRTPEPALESEIKEYSLQDLPLPVAVLLRSSIRMLEASSGIEECGDLKEQTSAALAGLYGSAHWLLQHKDEELLRTHDFCPDELKSNVDKLKKFLKAFLAL